MTFKYFSSAVLRFFIGVFLFSSGVAFSSTLPSGFIETTIGGTWTEAVGITFDPNGRMYVWEKAGKVWIVDNGVKSSQPLIDLGAEVGDWRDFGLTGFALDPGFLSNGYIYLMYAVDHNYLANYGTPNYDPNAKGYFRATIGRITRYTARSSDGFTSVDPSSRRVLLGESITNGFPILDSSHGLDSLVFGTDGTLMAGCGDASAFSNADTGGTNGGGLYNEQGVAEGIIRPDEDVGSYRAQMVDSLAGKIIRIDPTSGDGIPGNPYYDADHPRSARSRAWAIGLRNPFRMSLRRGTGSTSRADANPGVLYIGDVGWNTWEELDVARGPVNFGWPLYEGFSPNNSFSTNAPNVNAPNPLFGVNACSQQYFNFQELLHQDGAPPNPYFPNACDGGQQIPASIPKFIHTRPAIDWNHDTGTFARTGTYDGSGQATTANIGDAGSPVSGVQFSGNCSIGGVWYTGSDFPSNYNNTYFQGDYGQGWIKSFSFDTNNNPVSVQNFLSNGGGIVTMATHPLTGGLYYIAGLTNLVKITYIGSSNRPPVAVASSNKKYGVAPLVVQFTGTNSTDPEGHALTYKWAFGDATTSTLATPTHTFSATAGVPKQFTVLLTVTDNLGATNQTSLNIAANDTPPNVTITSPVNGSLYSMDGDSAYNLTANVSDAEQGTNSLSYAWQVILHHNEHVHTEPVDTNQVTSAVISPDGCDGNTYFYAIILKVTDSQGLFTTNEVRIYPDCPYPAAPGALTVQAISTSQINLNWVNHATNADSSQLERSIDGTNFVHLATLDPVVATYSDTGLAPSQSCWYRILAHNLSGDSAYSNIAGTNTFAPPEPSAPWAHGDIGSVSVAGGAGYSSGIFIVKGSGTDIYGTDDAFHFVYQPWTGDGKIIALVTRVDNTDGYAKAGLMFRETLASNSRNAFQFITPSQGLGYQARTNTGGATTYLQGSLMTVPYWLKLERTGNFFAGYSSLDGTAWLLLSSNNISMNATIYAGMALSSHNTTVLNNSTFENVQVRLPGGIPAMLINQLSNGTMAFGLQGENGCTYRVDTSTNLQIWVPFTTNINHNGFIPIGDSQSLPWRYYRGVRVN